LRPVVAKRLLNMAQAYDLLFVARKPLLSASAEEIEQTMALLFCKAKLI
jgi:RNase P protein component